MRARYKLLNAHDSYYEVRLESDGGGGFKTAGLRILPSYWPIANPATPIEDIVPLK
jgi:hypothetical protein